MAYFKHGVQLSEDQKRNLAHAGVNKTHLNIKLAHDKLSGSDELNLTQRQINKIKKCIETNVGTVLKLSKSQIQSMNKSGGFIPLLLAGLGALASLAGGASAIAKTVIDKRAKIKSLPSRKDTTAHLNKVRRKPEQVFVATHVREQGLSAQVSF